MKSSVRKLVHKLPGPLSYCGCMKVCDGQALQMDHVLPKKFLNERLRNREFKKAINDPHNIYRCCGKLNRKKSFKILGVDFSSTHNNGFLARACLYMNSRYELGVGKDLMETWKWMSLLDHPHKFEYGRNKEIFEFCKDNNQYISDFPTSSLNVNKYQ